MAGFEQHAEDCQRFLGDRCEAVNLWIDDYFKTLGPYHRKIRHHWEGIREAAAVFGDVGYQAAIIHILRDCRNIPHREDYETGRVDALGLLKDWPVTAYIKYAEQDFEILVMNNLVGSMGNVLWAFVDAPALIPFLEGLTRLTPPEVEQLLPRHADAKAKIAALQPIAPAIFPQKSLSVKVDEYFKELATTTPMLPQLRQVFPMADFAYVRVQDLISPLVYIDHEYIEELRPELASLDEADIAKFALPQSANVAIRGMTDPTQHSVNFVSSNKTLTVGPAQVTQINGGVEVRFQVAANLSVITVTKFQDRLILRNGIHRAYLLAKLGVTEIPCILSPEQNFPNLFITAYPAFVPQMFMQPRPPMLLDFLNDQLCLEVPLQRTRKVVKISAEESILPVD
jgi:hypothetical protein